MKNLKQFFADAPTYTHEAKKPLIFPPYFGSIRKIKSMDHLITCLTLLCQYFHDLSKEYKITQRFFEGSDPIVYHQETPQDNVRESNRRYPRAKAHTTIATDEGSSEDEPYPNYDEAQEILHAIESREAKCDLSCQPYFLVFHGKPCYPACQRDHSDRAMMDLAKKEFEKLASNPFYQKARSLGLITPPPKLATIPPNAQASRTSSGNTQRTVQRDSSSQSMTPFRGPTRVDQRPLAHSLSAEDYDHRQTTVSFEESESENCFLLWAQDLSALADQQLLDLVDSQSSTSDQPEPCGLNAIDSSKDGRIPGVMAELYDPHHPILEDNVLITTYAILDTCATHNFMSESLYLKISNTLDSRSTLHRRAITTVGVESTIHSDLQVDLIFRLVRNGKVYCLPIRVVILKNATTDLIIGLRELAASNAFRTEIFDPCVTNVLAMYKSIIAQESEPNSTVHSSAMHLRMMRSEDEADQDEASSSASQITYLTTLSTRNATPELLLASTLSFLQNRIEPEIQDIAQTFRAPHTEDAFLPTSSSLTYTAGTYTSRNTTLLCLFLPPGNSPGQLLRIFDTLSLLRLGRQAISVRL
jgi:hypothetical protein